MDKVYSWLLLLIVVSITINVQFILVPLIFIINGGKETHLASAKSKV